MVYFTIEMVLSGGNFLEEGLPKLIEEFCAPKFEETSVPKYFGEIVKDWSVYWSEGRKWFFFEPDPAKDFVSNLKAFKDWFYQLECASSAKVVGGWKLLWPRLNAEVRVVFGSDGVNFFCDIEDLMKGREALWDELMDLTKHLAGIFPIDYALSCMEYREESYHDEPGTPLERLKELFSQGKAVEAFPTLDTIGTKSMKKVWSRHYFPYPSFLILSRERFQACQPYFSRWPSIQRREELPNGAVFLFFGYPIHFEALQSYQFSVKAEGKEGESGMFVEVPLYPDEDLDAAYQRITQAFEEAGIKVYHPQMLHDIAPITDFARLFLVFTEEEAHTFFICPYEWTPERVEKMLVMVELVREMEREKVLPGVTKHVIHFLSAYPLPKELEEASKGERD
jgi:hypothetical protein